MATPGEPPDPQPYLRLTAGDLVLYLKFEWFVGARRLPADRGLPLPREVAVTAARDGRLSASFEMAAPPTPFPATSG